MLLAILVATSFAEEVLYKFSAGPAGGLFKTGGTYDYWALGQTYGGIVKFGITKEFEVGIQGSYAYTYPSKNIDFFPFVLRNADGEVLPYTEFHPIGNSFKMRADTLYPDGWRPTTYERARMSMDRNEDLPFKLVFIPIELLVQWRSFTNTIFNPYVQIGGGLFMWKVVDDENGDIMEVADNRDAVLDLILIGSQPPPADTNWVDYKGRHFQAMLGLGFEIFPVEQVGIDIGVRGYYPFADDQATFLLDTLVGYIELSARLNFYYGGVRDSDKDGVSNKDDQCPHSPFGAAVDEFGCPVDSDGDDVFDGLDMCPNTPVDAIVDAAGCPSDNDNDGVYDGIDKCMDTPSGAKVDEAGCPVDSDEDGVPDHSDNCPNTPNGALVDQKGCPMDGDGDGAYDGIDKCPATPLGTQVNQFGCPQTKGDSDGDGVTDDMDRCPDTPRGARVDEEGCPIDSDRDQVSDYKDKCPKTPDGCIVDEHGCPVDGDSDGVCDGVDQCPNTPDGVEVKADGCPKAKKLKKGESIRVKVYFETAKWDITPQGARDLQEAYRILKAYPKMMVLVEGHTDSKGTDEYNRELSIKRAKSIKTWLVTQGVASDRLETIGFGETRPVDTNETSDGRANNRRIEFRCTEGCAEEVEVE